MAWADMRDILETNFKSTPLPVEGGGTGAGSAEGAIANLGFADYIVAQGTSGIWTYQQFASGVAVCSGRYTDSIAVSTAYSPGYYNSSPVVVDFPFAFAKTPTVTATANALAHVATDSGNRGTSSVGLYCWRPSSGTVTEVNLTVIGRWK